MAAGPYRLSLKAVFASRLLFLFWRSCAISRSRMSVSTCRLTVDFILFLLLFCSAFFYLGLHGGTKFKIEASRKKQKKIEDEIEGLPQGRAGACRSPRPPRQVRSQYAGPLRLLRAAAQRFQRVRQTLLTHDVDDPAEAERHRSRIGVDEIFDHAFVVVGRQRREQPVAGGVGDGVGDGQVGARQQLPRQLAGVAAVPGVELQAVALELAQRQTQRHVDDGVLAAADDLRVAVFGMKAG